jgi:hypothetical protein
MAGKDRRGLRSLKRSQKLEEISKGRGGLKKPRRSQNAEEV